MTRARRRRLHRRIRQILYGYRAVFASVGSRIPDAAARRSLPAA